MPFISHAKCRQCGCRGYKNPIEGDNCYSCGHVRDLHLVQYMSATQSRGTTVPQKSPEAINTEATVDLSLLQGSKEDNPERASGICFEETVAAYEAPNGSSKGLHQLSLEPVIKSPKTNQSLTSKESRDQTSSAKRMAPVVQDTPTKKIKSQGTGLYDSPKAKPSYSPARVTPKKTRTADIFESPVPGNGGKPACWRLMMNHLPYGMEPQDGVKGAYKIAEDGQTIYVGTATKVTIMKLLSEKFRGKDKQVVGAYLSTLSEEYRQKHITLYWIDESEVEHTCGSSYLKCFTELEGRKPKYNMAGRNNTASGKVSSGQETGPLEGHMSDKSLD